MSNILPKDKLTELQPGEKITLKARYITTKKDATIPAIVRAVYPDCIIIRETETGTIRSMDYKYYPKSWRIITA